MTKNQIVEAVLARTANVPRACGEALDKALFREGENHGEIIQSALDEKKRIEIPLLPFPLLLNRTLVLRSGCSLKLDREQVIRMMPGCGGYMARNDCVTDGRFATTPDAPYDEDIAIEGGVWDMSPAGFCPSDDHEAMVALRKVILGVVFFCGARNFSLRHMTFRAGSPYGVLLTRCDGFVVEDLTFDNYKKDGVHVNGPSSYGVIRQIRGETGDDFVALNAWDWDSSSAHFGSIHHMLLEDLTANRAELRLLPGRKTFASGEKVDCDVYDIVTRRVTGIYDYKLYNQPNCHNKAMGKNDHSETAGNLIDVYFEDVSLDSLVKEGLADIHVDALFEVCADARNLSIERAQIGAPVEAFVETGMRLVMVGPKSETWKQGSEDPEKWAELFDTSIVCRADGVTLDDVRFGGVPCTDADALIGTRRLAPNPDYPNTTPAGGTGYGELGKVTIR